MKIPSFTLEVGKLTENGRNMKQAPSFQISSGEMAPKGACQLGLFFYCDNPCRAAASLSEQLISKRTQQAQGEQE